MRGSDHRSGSLFSYEASLAFFQVAAVAGRLFDILETRLPSASVVGPRGRLIASRSGRWQCVPDHFKVVGIFLAADKGRSHRQGFRMQGTGRDKVS
jgi:hypothetical protein